MFKKEFVKCIRKNLLDCSIENEKMGKKIKRHGEESEGIEERQYVKLQWMKKIIEAIK